MNSRGRIAAFAGAGVALVAGAFLLVAAGGDGGSVAAGSSTTTSSTTTTMLLETTTTIDLVPETTTSLAPRPPTTTTSTTAAPLPVVGATGAVLQPASSAANRKMDGEECDSLADEGWTSVTCGFATVKGGGTVVWLIETRVPGGTRAYVFGPASSGNPGSWRAVLEARDDSGSRWKSVEARVVDLSGDKADDVVFGFRAASGDGLSMDVVEGSAAVTAHRDLASGRSRVSPGQWDTWALLSSGQYQHDVIRWQDNAWRIVLRSEEPPSSVPPSQF